MQITIQLDVPVMAYGLRLNFRQEDGGFEGATRLLQIAHDIEEIKTSSKKCTIKANKTGTLSKISAIEVGKLSLELGAGKLNIKDKIDYTVGVKLNKLVGDTVKKGDILATLYVNDKLPDIDVDKIFTII